jgi:hypothetical protein
MSLFNINDAQAFFHSIKHRYRSYAAAKVRPTEDLLYVIMGLNHLREWIAPRYNYNNKDQKWPEPKTEAEVFSKEIFGSPEHAMVRELCNRTKHPKPTMRTSTSHNSCIDDWPDFDSVQNFDDGPPTAHFVETVPVDEYIVPLIERYEIWFKRLDT